MSEPEGAWAGDARRREHRHLRECVLAVSVLDDVDVTLVDLGVRLDGRRPVLVPWAEVAEVVGDHEPMGTVARRRLSVTLQLHRRVAEEGHEAPELLSAAARMMALPLGHAAHPGAAWVDSVQLGLAVTFGAAVTCGVGVSGLLADSDEVVPLPARVAEAAGAVTADWWTDLANHAEAMAGLAVQRLRRDHGVGPVGGSRQRVGYASSQPVLRPVGGVDVLTMLTTRTLRRYLAAEDGTGMRAVAVPMRNRGWYDLARIDPAYVAAAWSATDEWDRGLDRPVLITADAMTLPRAGGRTVQQSL